VILAAFESQRGPAGRLLFMPVPGGGVKGYQNETLTSPIFTPSSRRRLSKRGLLEPWLSSKRDPPVLTSRFMQTDSKPRRGSGTSLFFGRRAGRGSRALNPGVPRKSEVIRRTALDPWTRSWRGSPWSDMAGRRLDRKQGVSSCAKTLIFSELRLGCLAAVGLESSQRRPGPDRGGLRLEGVTQVQC